MDFPFVCTLTEDQLRERRTTIFAAIRQSAVTVDTLPDGYAYTFKTDSDTLRRLAELVDLERQCCRFLAFKIVVQPERELRLEITGPPEARSVIAEYFGSEMSG